MAKTVIGVFDDMSEAQRVVSDLLGAGASRDDISLLAGKEEGEAAAKSLDTKETKKASGTRAAEGAGIGPQPGCLPGSRPLRSPGSGPC